mmetsp:Transcript_27105/g.23968  ORF Transcript_27105/g.23968 Transcript_27105/m.23968 type:complete len:130 (-) Transcript_27105:264-653(-)
MYNISFRNKGLYNMYRLNRQFKTLGIMTNYATRSFVANPIDMEKRKKEKMEQAFKDDIKYFLSKEIFTLHDFHEKVKLGLKDKSSISVMIYGEDPEVKVLEGQNKVLSAIYEEEKRDISLLTKKKKREI